MDIIDMARQSGMAVVLDARIGREEYHSVCGSLAALQKFADAIRSTTRCTTEQDHMEERQARPARRA
ncbi:hypothetical protein P3T18_002738 [Paraburkholderia sp. GAS199]|uniref:hypothetical protein n=1 Tax=Paraburkholderia sp. GAS199 TaxID=3035126 RepID=UPI003D1A22DD